MVDFITVNPAITNREQTPKIKIFAIEEQEIFQRIYDSILSEKYDLEFLDPKEHDLSEITLRQVYPDVLILSLKKIDEKILDNIFELQNRRPSMGIIILLYSFVPDYTDLLRRLVSSKIRGLAVFMKSSLDMADQLMGIISSVLYGQVILDPQISTRLFSNDAECPFLLQMTNREREILDLLANGYTNAGIAKTLFLDIKTVEHHINSMYSKMKTIKDFAEKHPRVEAARIYLKATENSHG